MIIQSIEDTGGENVILHKYQPQGEIDAVKAFCRARREERDQHRHEEFQHVAEIPTIEVIKHPEILHDGDMMNLYLHTEGREYLIANEERYRGRATRVMTFDASGKRTDGGLILATN